ncbi:MAG: hypothetical protein ACO1PZ_04875, partial [Gammaproteobacteria bacterium]
MEKQVDSIPAQMSVAQAAKLSCWHGEDVMPVTGVQHQFIGVLRHADLRRALHQDTARAHAPPAGGDPLSGLVDAYGQSLLAVFNSVSSVVEHEIGSRVPFPGGASGNEP